MSIDTMRPAFKKARVPDATVRAFIAWAKADNADNRAFRLTWGAQFLVQLRDEFKGSVMQEEIKRAIAHALSGSPESFLQWTKTTHSELTALRGLRAKLGGWGTPNDVLDALAAWVWKNGTFNAARIEKIRLFTDALSVAPFSGATRAERWRLFLEAVMPADTNVHAIAEPWLAELEHPAGVA